MGILGIIFFIAVGYALSNNRKLIDWKLVGFGFLLQFIFAVLVIGIPRFGFTGPLGFFFSGANTLVLAILNFTKKGTEFLFGSLTSYDSHGFIFALEVLPIIIFMSSLMAILYHLGVMQKIVGAIAWVMQKTMGVSGAESLSAAANIFVGQTEAPLTIRPFLAKMTESELFCMMVGGMATVAGAVLAAYVGMLQSRIPDIAGHLIAASVLSAPAALVIAKIMYPENAKPETMGDLPKKYLTEKQDVNVLEAATRGATEGLYLALNVAAMLLAFIAIIKLLDASFAELGAWAGQPELSLTLVLGWLFAPVAWIMGIPWNEALIAGNLLGQKILANEFLAYLSLTDVMDQLSDKTVLILSYALCGFANFSSIGIIVGGLSSIIPERRKDMSRIGFKAMIGGAIAAFFTASLAGVLY